MSAAITKDSSIWRILGALAERIDFQHVQVIDHWDADLFAIAIARAEVPTQLVYVSTFRKAPGYYAYECEQSGTQIYEVAARSEDASFDQLVEIVQKHLSLGFSE